MVIEKAPAKINLCLDVLGKRDDGYHELEMVMTTIDLQDRIFLYPERKPIIRVESSSSNIPTDQRNLAYRAAALLREQFGVTQGVSIYIQKHIPVSAGLGGGSTDAAAVLRGLNRLWNLKLSLDDLAHIALDIGSDVPFCVYGGTAIARGRGERLEFLPPPPPCWIVLAKPPFSVSTKEVYEALRIEDIRCHPQTDRMIQAIRAGRYEMICRHTCNVLEKVTMRLYPEVELYKEQIARFGADAALMSGSGPTIFALVRLETRVTRLVNALRGFCRDVYAVRLLRNPYNRDIVTS